MTDEPYPGCQYPHNADHVCGGCAPERAWKPGDLFSFTFEGERRWGKLLAYVEEEDGWIWQQVAPLTDRFQRRTLLPAHKLAAEERPNQDLLLAMPLHGDVGYVLTLTEAQAQAIEVQLALYARVLRAYDVAHRECERERERKDASRRLGHTDSRKKPRKTHAQLQAEGRETGAKQAANAALLAICDDVVDLLPLDHADPMRPSHRECSWGAYAALADNPRFQAAAEHDDAPAALEAENSFGVVTLLPPRERLQRREDRERRFEEMPGHALRWRKSEQERDEGYRLFAIGG